MGDRGLRHRSGHTSPARRIGLARTCARLDRTRPVGNWSVSEKSRGEPASNPSSASEKSRAELTLSPSVLSSIASISNRRIVLPVHRRSGGSSTRAGRAQRSSKPRAPNARRFASSVPSPCWPNGSQSSAVAVVLVQSAGKRREQRDGLAQSAAVAVDRDLERAERAATAHIGSFAAPDELEVLIAPGLLGAGDNDTSPVRRWVGRLEGHEVDPRRH